MVIVALRMTSYRDILLKSPRPALKAKEEQCKVKQVEKWVILSRSKEVPSEAPPPEAPPLVVVVVVPEREREIRPKTQVASSQDVKDRHDRQRWVKKYRKLKAGTATDWSCTTPTWIPSIDHQTTIEFWQEEEKPGSYFRQAALARLKKASTGETETKNPNYAKKKKKVKNPMMNTKMKSTPPMKLVPFDTDSDTTLCSLARRGLHKEASVFIRTLVRKAPLDEPTLSKVLQPNDDDDDDNSSSSSSSYNIFHIIAARGDVTFMRMILHGLKSSPENHAFLLKTFLNQPDSWMMKSTPVHVAAQGGHVELVKIFLRHGAKAQLKDAEGNTLLHLAAARGHDRLVDYLVSSSTFQGHQLMNGKNKSGQTPLLLACVAHCAGAARRLLKAGVVKLDIVDRYNQYPLLGAIRSGDEMLVQAMLRRGAKVCTKPIKGQQRCRHLWALHEAVRLGMASIVDLLLQSVAREVKTNASFVAMVNQVDHLGETPLSLAIQGGYGAIVSRLVDKECQAMISSKALSLALACAPNRDIIDTLVRAHEKRRRSPEAEADTVEESRKMFSKVLIDGIKDRHWQGVARLWEIIPSTSWQNDVWITLHDLVLVKKVQPTPDICFLPPQVDDWVSSKTSSRKESCSRIWVNPDFILMREDIEQRLSSSSSGPGPDSIVVHRSVLVARCDYFRALVSFDDSCTSWTIPREYQHVFPWIVMYFYTDECTMFLEGDFVLGWDQLLLCMKCANELLLGHLQDCCGRALEKNFCPDNIHECLEWARVWSDVRLIEACERFLLRTGAARATSRTTMMNAEACPNTTTSSTFEHDWRKLFRVCDHPSMIIIDDDIRDPFDRDCEIRVNGVTSLYVHSWVIASQWSGFLGASIFGSRSSSSSFDDSKSCTDHQNVREIVELDLEEEEEELCTDDDARQRIKKIMVLLVEFFYIGPRAFVQAAQDHENVLEFALQAYAFLYQLMAISSTGLAPHHSPRPPTYVVRSFQEWISTILYRDMTNSGTCAPPPHMKDFETQLRQRGFQQCQFGPFYLQCCLLRLQHEHDVELIETWSRFLLAQERFTK